MIVYAVHPDNEQALRDHLAKGLARYRITPEQFSSVCRVHVAEAMPKADKEGQACFIQYDDRLRSDPLSFLDLPTIPLPTGDDERC